METRINAPNILIVDDEIGPRESLRMILKPYYNIFTAESGYGAIQMVKQIGVDVITLDLKMPGLSGIDTLKEIRAIRCRGYHHHRLRNAAERHRGHSIWSF